MALAGTTTALTAQPTGRVKCTAIYRERMALPPDSVLEAMLEDVSKADAPAELIASLRIEKPGNPPYTFEIAFDPAKIDESHRYAVRARILVAGAAGSPRRGIPFSRQQGTRQRGPDPPAPRGPTAPGDPTAAGWTPSPRRPPSRTPGGA